MLEARPSLTVQQDRLLSFIEASLAETRVAPSFDAMACHLGLKSKSNVSRLLDGLESRGYITRRPHCARAISLNRPLATVPAYVLMAELRSRGLAVRIDAQ